MLKVRRAIASTALGLYVLASQASAQSAAPTKERPDPASVFQAAFDEWAQKHKPQTAIAIVQIGGRPVFSQGFNADPAAPTFIGSMSKAITAACIATLIGDGKLSFSTTVKDALPGFFRKHGPPADKRLESVTIEQLLVHRSGLRGNSDGDPIHAMIRKRAATGLAGEASVSAMLAEHFRGNLIRDPGADFSYGNTGYMVLAEIIEEKSGRSYEDYCRSAVFDKLAIRSARMHPEWRVLSGAGGWFITPDDYMSFMKIFDSAHPFLPKVVKDWIDEVRSKWPPADPRGNWYSLGVYTHANFGRWFVTHGGMLDSEGRDRNGKPISAIISSNAIRAADGTSLVYAMTPSKGADPAMRELRDALNRAIQVVRAK